MTHLFRCKMKPYIQPFERRLALAELGAIAGTEPRPVAARSTQHILKEFAGSSVTFALVSPPLEFEVVSDVPAEALVEKLAYWESVCGEEKQLTTQVLREATVNFARNGITPDQMAQHLPLRKDARLPNRRSLRYGTHGIHEYRGKFFPQLVRALMNIARVPDQGIVADPMCGSGTTAVEAMLSGYHGIGLDYNPLSVLMSRTKCALLSVDPALLVREAQAVRHDLLQVPPADPPPVLPYFATLSAADQKYLIEWFSERVLRELDRVACAIYARDNGPVRDLMLLALSNIIRHVSWQKDEDLRVRREVRPDDDIDPVREFLEELEGSVKTVLTFLYQNRGAHLGDFEIRESDARMLGTTWQEFLGRVDVIITSPPYATALPYLDTDRLSLYYLGLLSRAGHRRRDHEMIGNREITDKLRESYWQRFQEERQLLPEQAAQLIERIHGLNSTAEVGFRRQNVAALLAKYFLDMREVLMGIAQLLRPGACAFVVIGDNHTTAGGERVEIETANILRAIALMVGLEQGEDIPMEMLAARGIFSHNAVASEVILSFRRSAL